MSYSDSIIIRTNESVDDEYERTLIHQASTVTLTYSMWAVYVSMVVMSFFLPGWKFLLILAPLTALLAGHAAGHQWLKQRTARPRPAPLTTTEWLALITLLVLMFVGNAVGNSSYGPLTEFGPTLAGGFVGGLIGLCLAIWLVPRTMRRNREQDAERLEAELAD